MKVEIFASGSSGNCYKIESGNTTLLIECGISYKKIQQKMQFRMTTLDGVLVTHEHIDHAKAAKDIIRNGIDLYITQGTKEALGLSGHRVKTFNKENDTYDTFSIGEIEIRPFKTVHDASEPVGFVLKDKTDELVFITDTAYVEYTFNKPTIMMVECNYVKEILDENVDQGYLNISLRNRIVKNHMSLETLKELLKANDLSRLKKVYILHLSDSNSDEDYIKEEVQKITGVPVEVC